MDTQLKEKKEELSITNLSLSRLAQQNKVLELQIQEITNSGNTTVWESCGKTFLTTKSEDYISKLKQQINDNKDSINSLGKKQNYLETTVKTTYDNMRQLLGPESTSKSA
ncbi:hypothetical protein KL905_001491 [Ogataea polymorpha]|uniref:Uncharacterized protein n=1 Tax=Ogataea polymorpha TaxID=460523 RepID=A0A1B7SM47_9ASCO|nr:uncharacterized protein OGAPODRAFT_92773 [Ogataea polymorpha]KAG7879998.1 hypothetical protein KL937_002882 [Ogataea polymorpha]KAG7893087.1 hypothetical protein KL936_001261 [Ogataea polymorpha]KAG7897084.1 hypothetical protein KL908_000486 [Ogataea polymorpha]KAG7912284.1 hypothetical protein KL906_000488 [Ogataea polymorpha]KAG7919953.1 hypothetical protein KL927_000633 [Ogataea polymorpha]